MITLDIIMTLVTLTALEIVLGIDNLIFLSILTEKLPQKVRKRARYWGLSFAWVSRLLLLAFAVYLVKLQRPIFSINELSFSVHDLFLLVGGFFLIAKSTQEIHMDVERPKRKRPVKPYRSYSFWKIVFQIMIMDMVFSLDSVLTAIGLTSEFFIMAIAITISIFMMLYVSTTIAQFIERNPTIKMLALCFILLIGMMLIADGFSFHIPRTYLYVAMGFSLIVECLNAFKKRRKRD